MGSLSRGIGRVLWESFISGRHFYRVINQWPSTGMGPCRVRNTNPKQVRPEFFTRDFSARRLLNTRTVLIRHKPTTSKPVVHQLSLSAQFDSKRRLAVAYLDSFSKSVHAAHYQHVFINSQHVAFELINTRCKLAS